MMITTMSTAIMRMDDDDDDYDEDNGDTDGLTMFCDPDPDDGQRRISRKTILTLSTYSANAMGETKQSSTMAHFGVV